MALERTQSVELSIDGTYMTIIDTTALQQYIDNGISNPVTEVDDIILSLNTNGLIELSEINLTASASDLRSAEGLKVYFADMGISSPVTDDYYIVKMTWTFDTSDYTSESNELFYATITNTVAKTVASGDWRDSTEPLSKMSYSKYTLALKKALDNLVLADANNQYIEGLKILDSLKSIL